MYRSWVAAASVALAVLPSPVGAASPASPGAGGADAPPGKSPVTLAAPEHGKRLDPKAPLWVDLDGGRVLVDGRVALREGMLEMFACPSGTKEHESVVAVDAPAQLLHAALLAIGATPGTPVRFEPEYRAPTGDRIAIRVEWRDADGAARNARAQDWVRDARTGRAMTLPFVFAGSGFWTDPDSGRRHYMADDGDLICVSNFQSATLDVPAPSSQDSGSLLFQPFTERIPPVGSPVRLVLQVDDAPAGVMVGSAAEPVPRAAVSTSSPSGESSLRDALEALRAAPIDAGSTPALQAAWRRVSKASEAELAFAIRALSGASPEAENWLRSAIDAAAERHERAGTLPEADLRALIDDPNAAPRARRTAFEWLVATRPDLRPTLLAGMLDDSSIELRYDAVAEKLEEARFALDDAKKRAAFHIALQSGRTIDQFEAAAAGLESLGEKVRLADELGFLSRWRVVGPFPNKGGAGFGAAQGPEASIARGESPDAAETFPGGAGPELAWKAVVSADRMANIDLNAALGAEKDVLAYAWATVSSDEEQPVELRYTTAGASKAWVNGEQVAEHEVYHNGTTFDQWRASARLRRGANQIVVKICQNAQTEPWANEWAFQLRVTTPDGAPAPGVATADDQLGSQP